MHLHHKQDKKNISDILTEVANDISDAVFRI